MKLIRIDGTCEEVNDPRALLQTAADDLIPGTSALGSIGYRDLDPHGRLVADPQNVVWRPNAFRSYATESEYRTIRGIIGRNVRPKKQEDPRLDASLLPPMRCGAPDAHGHRCGLTIRAAKNRWGQLRYSGAKCKGHSTDLSRAIEPIILTIIGEAFAQVLTRRPAPSMAVEARSLDRQVATLREELRRTEERIVQLTRTQLDAHDDLRTAANLTLAHDLEDRTRLQRAIADAEDAHRRAISPATQKRIWHVLQSMAIRLSHVMTRVKQSPALCRRLVQALTRRITVCSIADHMVQLEITYATGVCAEYLVVIGDLCSTQPQRLWAYEQLVRGRAETDVASELDVGKVRRYRSRMIQPGFVRTLALVHRWFEPTSALASDVGETIQSLAQRTHESVGTIRQYAMTGHLGTARVDEAGALVIMPTELHLEMALPDYARRRVVERMGWNGQAITHREAVDQSGQSIARLRSWKKRGLLSGAKDLAGRAYFDRDQLDRCLSAFGRLRVTSGTRQLFECARERAVASAGFAPALATDFHVQADLLVLLREHGIAANAGLITRRIADGRLLSIPYDGPASSVRNHASDKLIYFPLRVMSECDEAEARRYLDGEAPLPTSTNVTVRATPSRAPKSRPQ